MAFDLIKFKKGTESGLATLKSGNHIEEGSFYLTIDSAKNTSRLYIGTGASTVLPVNSNITVVSQPEDLTAAHAATFNDGDFAYVTTGNILAVRYNGQWTQINAPDSRAIKDLTPSISTSNDGVATITWALRDQDDHVIQTSDNTPVNPAITMAGANGVTVSNSDRNITITGTAYELHSPAVVTDSNTAIIRLQNKSTANGSLTNVSSVTVSAGANVSITGDANNIAIAAVDTTLSDQSLSITNNATSGFDISVIDTDGNGDTETIDPKITLGTHTAAADQISFVNGVANLPVYTKAEIDSQNRALNAMTYKGTVGTNGSAADDVDDITSVSIGDTFKLLGDATTTYTVPVSSGPPATAHGGDLIIANGTEDSNGYITTGLFYDIIPSGDEEDVLYKGLSASGANTGNGIQIEDTSSTVLASIEIAAAADSQIAVSSTHTGTNGEKAVVNIAHGTISASTNGDAVTGNLTTANTQDPHGQKTFNVVTGLTTANGHVTGTTITPIKVVDTVSVIDATTSGVAVSVPASNAADYQKAATVTSSLALVDEGSTPVPDTSNNNSTDFAFTLRSDNLRITASGTSITANYVWETF